ncbi:uncharacterized protein LOC105662771 [Megachile rotundata]|uniref:uncharacterized protein LOC105662771 n=1 Tax=Megachile rotundata TaxID=143995 RepID=UPI0006150378|nr:PREDICTED: uncharacterized protein LOC105662771 [Megachile rotundata]
MSRITLKVYPIATVQGGLNRSEVNRISFATCNSCPRKILNPMQLHTRCKVCSSANSSLFVNNNMDPGSVPFELACLTNVEELLIARIHPVICYFKIRGGQTGYKDNVINFRQDITGLCDTLLPTDNELRTIFIGTNHRYYHDININERRLSQLENEPNLEHLLENVVNAEPQSGDEYDDHLNESFYPHLPNIDQEEAIRRRLNEDEVLRWPMQENQPINEFDTEGYIAQAFPTLFPFGRADLNQERNRRIKPNDYFKYLMEYNDVDEVLQRIEEEPRLQSSLMVYASQLRSTTPYWKARCGELLDMVTQLGSPTVFFTLSAADYHWNKLFQLISPNLDVNNIDDNARRRLIHENPMITAEFFKRRVEIFRKTFLKPVFRVNDFWMRYEWQFRGSPHVHGLLWLDNAPSLTSIATMTEAEKNVALAFCDGLTKAWNPDSSVRPANGDHPCRKIFSEIENLEEDLALILNTVQRHTRCGQHCIRKVRNSNLYACRFKFPQPLCEESTFVEENGAIVFLPKRNDPLLNRYNKLITQTWRANVDIAIVTSIEAILNYIAKYVSKGEVASTNFSELIARIADLYQANDNGTVIIRKLLQASLTGRDYSAQEVCHVLMGWPIFERTRTFVVLNLNENQWVPIDAANLHLNNMITRYRTRARSLNVTLFDFYKNFKIERNEVKRRQKSTIVRVFPRLKNSVDAEMQESFYKQQLTLHIPWWHAPDTLLQRPNEAPFETWAEAYVFYNMILDEELPLNENDDEFEAIEPRNENELNLEMALARIRQDWNVERPLGERIIDFEINWAREREFDYSLPRIRNFLTNFREQPLNNDEQQLPQFNPSNEQLEIYQLCCAQISEIVDEVEPQISRTLIQGKAGTGKSFLINRMVHTIRSRLGDDAVKVLAPTGVAATNISGSTIHSFLKIPIFARFQPLSGNAQRQFQLQMEPVKFLIFDEYSMIGLDAWRKIEQRCREAYPLVDSPFGGLRVYFFGDLQQLPPVKDAPIFKYNTPRQEHSLGKIAFQTIQRFCKMTTSLRQNSPQQLAFRDLLDALALGEMNEENYNLLTTRLMSRLQPDERNIFRATTHLFPTNADVFLHNQKHLAATGYPVVKFDAEHNNALAAVALLEKASVLSASLCLSINAKVMLRKNLWVAGGLVNGSLGHVTDIIYDEGRGAPSLPRVIMVKFDSYLGSNYDDGSFPILPIEASWSDGHNDCTRKQFPLVLAYAMTIHKAQGLTLDKAVVHLGTKETVAGLSYVALS